MPQFHKVYLDAAIVIYTVEKQPDFWPRLSRIWEQLHQERVELIASQLLYLEVLVKPKRERNATLVNEFVQFLSQPVISLIPTDLQIMNIAADLRASQNLKTPDAIHLATAINCNCDAFFTNDDRLIGKADIEFLKIN